MAPAGNSTAKLPHPVRRGARKTRAPPSPLKYDHLMNNKKCEKYKAKRDGNKKRVAKAKYDKR